MPFLLLILANKKGEERLILLLIVSFSFRNVPRYSLLRL
jgi:hypothetical protein